MITGIIYKYTSPSNKIYVGKTINESERKHAFLTKERYAGIKIDNARAKYGPKNFKYDVIERHEYSSVEEATESLNILEAYYIGLYNSLVKGYNMLVKNSVWLRLKKCVKDIEELSHNLLLMQMCM